MALLADGAVARTFSLVGPGRAGRSLARALEHLGWSQAGSYGRLDDPAPAAAGVELCIVATPDDAIAAVARSIEPGDAVVMHLSGVTPLTALGSHRAAALHPLVALPDPDRGAVLLRSAWFAVAGDDLAAELADRLSGRFFEIADEDRALYHAAAVVASNHVVALLGQADRIAAEIGLPFEALVSLVQATIGSVADLGPAAALTGPAARGDHATISAHLAALGDRLPDEVPGYEALVDLARRLASEQSAE